MDKETKALDPREAAHQEARKRQRAYNQKYYVPINDLDETAKERRRARAREQYRKCVAGETRPQCRRHYTDETRTCPRCGKEKPTAGWHKSKVHIGGLMPWCNDCAKDYIRERHSDLRKNNPAKMLWHSTRKRAKGYANGRKLEFTLKVSDIIVPAVCPILGIPLYFACEEVGSKANRWNEHTPSIDRIDSSRGYTPDNIVVVSWRANRIKCDATVEELRRIYEFYQQLEAAKG